MYPYELVSAFPPEGEWPVGYTVAGFVLEIAEVPPAGTSKGGIHSDTIFGY